MFLKKREHTKITTEKPKRKSVILFFFDEYPTTNFCTLISFFFFNTFIHLKFLGELKTTFLKFGSVWILHLEILEFRFYPLNFESICILHLNVSEFRFYSFRFRSVWISSLKFGSV